MFQNILLRSDIYLQLYFELLGGSKMEDKKVTCKECGNEFIFTVGEQEFYKEKGFENEPKKCKECRAKAKSKDKRRSNYSR